MAQIHVKNIETEKPKAINVFRDGVWQNKKIGFLYVDKAWVPFIFYDYWVYKLGVEYVPIEKTTGSGGFNKRSDSLQFIVNHIGYKNVTVSTSKAININGFNKFNVDWRGRDTRGTFGYFSIGLSLTPDGPVILEKREFGSFSRVLSSIDISDLRGDVYIQITMENTNFEIPGYSGSYVGDIYQIWFD